ncbi:SRPBCC domain-containing protein [Pseudomaricurvus hydrocarbonicus]|nr:SRPBCC domain-containing protein [Aestuariicella hydrocarbonica]
MAKDIVTSISVDIDAPASLVWQVLTDLERYGDWNPYTVRVESSMQLHEKVDLYLPKPDGSGELMMQREYLLCWEPQKRLSWGMKWLHPWLLGARRDQYLETLPDGKTRYYTTDRFSGLFTKAVMKNHGAWIKQGFDDVARQLKARAEALV